jgi:hypothetical protein
MVGSGYATMHYFSAYPWTRRRFDWMVAMIKPVND